MIFILAILYMIGGCIWWGAYMNAIDRADAATRHRYALAVLASPLWLAVMPMMAARRLLENEEVGR